MEVFETMRIPLKIKRTIEGGSECSPEAFAKALRDCEKEYSFHIPREEGEIGGRIEKASSALAGLFRYDNAAFRQVFKLLEGVPNTVLAAERLRFLATCRVKDEREIANYDKDYVHSWDGQRKPLNVYNAHFDNLLKLSDRETADAYRTLAAVWEKNVCERKAVFRKIEEARDLLRAGEREAALLLSKETCEKLPLCPYAWAWQDKATTFSTQSAFLKTYQTIFQMDEWNASVTLYEVAGWDFNERDRALPCVSSFNHSKKWLAFDSGLRGYTPSKLSFIVSAATLLPLPFYLLYTKKRREKFQRIREEYALENALGAGYPYYYCRKKKRIVVSTD